MSHLSRAGSALVTIESSVEELEVPDLRRSSLTLIMMMMMLMMWPLAISEDHDDGDHDHVACSPLLCPRGSEVGTDRLLIWRMVALRSRVALGSEEALVMKRRMGRASLSGRSPAWPA